MSTINCPGFNPSWLLVVGCLLTLAAVGAASPTSPVTMSSAEVDYSSEENHQPNNYTIPEALHTSHPSVDEKQAASRIIMYSCGRKVPKSPSNIKISEYTHVGTQWPSNEVSYRITKYSEAESLSQADTDSVIRQAFNTWAAVTPLTFTNRRAGPVDIDIRFERFNHLDYPFDGPGGDLAHAFKPGRGIRGDAHFDDSENWTVDPNGDPYLLQTATHELGHSLGLGHSPVENAVMFPSYKRNNIRLHPDDIAGIQKLYGPRLGQNRRRGGNQPRGGPRRQNRRQYQYIPLYRH